MAACDETIALAQSLAKAASEKQATSGTCIDVSENLVLAEVFLIFGAASERQMRAIVNSVDEAAHKAGYRVKHREGMGGESHWILLDYGDLIVHVFHEGDRDFYALDKLWGDCPVIDLDCDFASDDVQANPLVVFSS